MGFGKRHPTGQSFLERRRARRQQTQSIGPILIPGKPPHPCVIAQFSDSGASLQLSSLFGVASSFELRAFGRIYTARVVRKASRMIFVTFSSEDHSVFSLGHPAA
jgi:hypothetical protein